MKLALFVGHYLGRYWRWGALALVSTAAFALTTLFLVTLIRPIFGEVLGTSAFGLPDEVAQIVAPPPGVDEAATSAPGTPKPAVGKSSRVFVNRWLHDGYEAVKRTFGVTPDNVVWFVPILFVLVFLARGISDFANGYAFQRIGFGATTDLRNDLYRRTLDQSSRFHAEHPSGDDENGILVLIPDRFYRHTGRENVDATPVVA